MPERGALVTALILERPMCESCIAVKSGLSGMELDSTLDAIRRSLRVYNATDRCRACGNVTTVLSVLRPI